MSDAWAVNWGIDTLVVNAYHTDEKGEPVKRDLDGLLVARLEEWKREAQGTHDLVSTSLTFNGVLMQMYPNGAGRGQWRWVLETGDIKLYISGGQWNGIASVRFSSAYLWSCPDVLDAIIAVQVFLNELFQDELFLQPSLVDLCVDIAGWSDIEQMDRKRNFVSRSRKRGVHLVPDWGYDAELQQEAMGLHETGFVFSKNGALSCRIYDKTREIMRSGKEWCRDLWALRGWSETDGAVWRVEFSFKREALHDLLQDGVFWGVENVYELPDRLSEMWVYAAGQVQGGKDGLPDGWLRCVLPNEDKNRSRWPTHSVWRVIQGAFIKERAIPEQFGEIIRERHEKHNIDKGVEAVIGYITSLSAWVGGELASPQADLSLALHWLVKEGEKYLERKERDFALEVQRKRKRMKSRV